MKEFKQGDIIADDYEIIKQLSEGSFGTVYLGRSVSNNISVAIKVEKSEVAYFNSLSREIEVLKLLKEVPQVPQVFWSGQQSGYNIMIQNMLGKDLIYYFKKLKHFSYECVCNIMRIYPQQVCYTCQFRNVIHRDLKPENILGSLDSQFIHLIDFGIAKNMESRRKSKEKISFIGTTRYASLAAHFGIEQSKKDDLESLGYMIIYFLNKTLPWMNIEKGDMSRIEKIGLMKQEISVEQLCLGLPKSILKYMRYVKTLRIKYKPNYAQLKSLFAVENYQYNLQPFDWNTTTSSKSKIYSNKSLKIIQNSIHSKSPQKHNKIINLASFNVVKENSHKSGSSNFNSNHQSSLKENEQQDSIRVDYSISYEASKLSKSVFFKKEKSLKSLFGQQYLREKSNNRLSFLDQYNENSDSATIQSKQQLQELENQDLEVKYNLLHYTSVFYNFKNPIEDFKVIYLDIE